MDKQKIPKSGTKHSRYAREHRIGINCPEGVVGNYFREKTREMNLMKIRDKQLSDG